MTMPDASSRRRQAEQQVLDRAATDPGFRAQLLENPRQALQEEFGISIPETVSLRVAEEQPGEVILVLPNQPAQSGASLSDADLEQVAGGVNTGPFDDTCSGYC